MQIALERIISSPEPVRTEWDERRMQELTESIRTRGVIVPVRLRPAGDKYEIVYGHRRVEASRRAGCDSIDATVVPQANSEAMTDALIENVVREEMTELDKGKAVLALIGQGRTLRDVAKTLGYSDRSKPGQGDPTIPSRWAQLAQDEKMLKEVLDEVREETGQAPRLNGLAAKLYGATPAEIRREAVLRRAMAKQILAEGLTAQDVRDLSERLRRATTVPERLKLIERASEVLDELEDEADDEPVAARPERIPEPLPRPDPLARPLARSGLGLASEAPSFAEPPSARAWPKPPASFDERSPAELPVADRASLPPAEAPEEASSGGAPASLPIQGDPVEAIRRAAAAVAVHVHRLADSPQWAGKRDQGAMALRELAGDCLSAAAKLQGPRH